MWVQDRLPLAMLKDHGTNLQTVQQFIKKNQVSARAAAGAGGTPHPEPSTHLHPTPPLQNLRREIQVHRPRVDEVLERATAVASIKSPEAEAVRSLLERLGTMWAELQEQTERRQQALDATYQLEQYYFDVAEVESWLGEQELLLMNEEKGKVAFRGLGLGWRGWVNWVGWVGSARLVGLGELEGLGWVGLIG